MDERGRFFIPSEAPREPTTFFCPRDALELVDFLSLDISRPCVSGVVKFFNPHSSFGYIIQDDGSEDLYVHAKALGAVPGGVLQAGDKVEYRVAVFNERPRAKDVRVLKRA